MVDLDQAGKDCDGVRVIRERGALSRFVEFYWIDDAKEGDPQGREGWRIVPDTSGHLLFHVFDAGGGEVDCSRLQVVGARSVFKDIDKRSRLLTVGVRFRPGSTSLFTGADADELTDCSLALADLMGQVAVDAEDGLRRMALETPVAALNDLRYRLGRHFETATAGTLDPRISAAVAELETSSTPPSAAALANAAGSTPRTLRALLRRHVGFAATPSRGRTHRAGTPGRSRSRRCRGAPRGSPPGTHRAR